MDTTTHDRIRQQVTDNGVVTAYTTNKLNQYTDVGDVHYTYDPAGNITKITDAPDGGTTDTQCFTNDYLGRLVEAWTPGSGDCTTAPSTAI